MESSNLTVCGRPKKNDYSMFSLEGTDSPGDPNYGYSTKSCAYSAPSCKKLPNGSSSSKTDMTCGDIWSGSIPASCLEVGPTCFAKSNNTGKPTTYFCQSNWDSVNKPLNEMLCCSGMESSSSICDPSWCPLNQEFCQGKMMEYCTPDNWTSSDSFQRDSCDQYIAAQRKIGGKCPVTPTNPPPGSSNWDCAQYLIYNAVDNFYNSNKPSDDDPFVRKSIELCSIYPGLCDPILKRACSSYSADDLAPSSWIGRKYDPSGTNLINTCGCFLDQSASSGNYVIDPSINMGVSCNALCSFPGNIPATDSNGNEEQCKANVCALDNISVNVVNSTTGSVNMNQYCGKCDGKTPCICYFNDITFNDVGGELSKQISNNCNVCFQYNPDNPSKPVKVDCSNPLPPTPLPPIPPQPLYPMPTPLNFPILNLNFPLIPLNPINPIKPIPLNPINPVPINPIKPIPLNFPILNLQTDSLPLNFPILNLIGQNSKLKTGLIIGGILLGLLVISVIVFLMVKNRPKK